MKVAVMGAGHGGLATAGHLKLKNHSVHLFSFYKAELDPVRERGGIELSGEVEGFSTPDLVTSSVDEAVRGVDLVAVVMPALAHRNIASLLSGCLQDGQTLLLTPGRTGGALEVYQTLRRFQCKRRVVLGECQTFIYATESRGPAHVEIMKIKHRVRASALPALDNEPLLDVMNELYPEYAPAANVLETSINNTGAVVHPAPMLLNSGLLERAAAGEDLRYYRDVISRFVCDHVMERIDAEKSAVARGIGAPVYTVREWYEECYGVTGDSLYEALQNNAFYTGFSAPRHVLGYHHVLDEVPNSLVPIAAFGRAAQEDTPMVDAVVNLACAALGHDYWREGRTLDKLGLEGLSPEEMLEFVARGPRFWEM